MLNWLLNLLGLGRRAKAPLPPFSALHMQRLAEFAARPLNMGGLAIMGDSHAQLWGSPENAALLAMPHQNYGIGGDTSRDALQVLPFVVQQRPAAVIVSIGSNNLGWGTPEAAARFKDDLWNLAMQLITQTQALVVFCEVLPVSSAQHPELVGGRTPQAVARANAEVMFVEAAMRGRFPGRTALACPGCYLTSAGQLRPEYAFDGAHLNLAGYTAWAGLLNTVLLRPVAGR